MALTTTKRLSPAQRRAQLIEIGMRLIEASSFDAVPIDRVAEEAGISRSLLFHYFPTKRDFQVAVAEYGADELLAATEPDETLAPEDRLRASLDAFLSYVARRGHAFTSVVRGASGGDPALQAVFDRAHGVVATRVLGGLGVDEAGETALLRIAVRGWVAFIEESAVVWLASGGATQEQLVGVFEAALVAAVTAADLDGSFAELLAAYTLLSERT
jgi:AcrR family transcriptional regulator